MIRVVLADDHEMVRAGFKMILESDPNVSIVGEASEGNQAYALVAREHPDVLLLDISMPGGQSGLVACEEISRDFPDTKIIMLTMYSEPDYLFYTLRGGASGYCLKSATPAELMDALHTVMAGGTYVHPRMKAVVSQSVNDGTAQESAALQQLSTRELEILQLLAKGFTNKEIAEQVFLSVKTVEAHRAKIYSKLGFKSRADLVSFAMKHHLLNL